MTYMLAGIDSAQTIGQWVSGANLLMMHHQEAKVLNCISVHNKGLQKRSAHPLLHHHYNLLEIPARNVSCQSSGAVLALHT